MNDALALSRLTVQGVVGAKIVGGVLVSCSLAPAYLTVPRGIIKIGDYCFSGQDHLEEVRLINDVSSIGVACFANCPALARIVCNPCLRAYEKVLKYGNHAVILFRN